MSCISPFIKNNIQIVIKFKLQKDLNTEILSHTICQITLRQKKKLASLDFSLNILL